MPRKWYMGLIGVGSNLLQAGTSTTSLFPSMSRVEPVHADHRYKVDIEHLCARCNSKVAMSQQWFIVRSDDEDGPHKSNPMLHRLQLYWSDGFKARRKPMIRVRSVGTSPERCADRQSLAVLFQSPPRITRLEPDVAPNGSELGDDA